MKEGWERQERDKEGGKEWERDRQKEKEGVIERQRKIQDEMEDNEREREILTGLYVIPKVPEAPNINCDINISRDIYYLLYNVYYILYMCHNHLNISTFCKLQCIAHFIQHLHCTGTTLERQFM